MARFDPFSNELPSKMKEVFESPDFLAAIKSDNLEAAKMIASNIINQSDIKPEDKELITQTIESQQGVETLQKYIYNSYLKHIGLGVVGSQDLIEKLTIVADKLDARGLKAEADQIDEFIRTAAMADDEEEDEKERKKEEDERLEGILPYFRKYVDRLSSLTKELEAKGLITEANIIKSILAK